MGRITDRLLAALLPVIVLGLFATGSPAWAGEARRENVTVRWDEGLAAVGETALRALPAVRREVDRRLGWPTPATQVEVVLVSGLGRMREAAQAHVPDWAVGVAIASSQRIVIRTDLLAEGWGGSLTQVLRHEWVHLSWGCHAPATRRDLPLWLEEGIAEEVGGGISIDAGATLDYAVAFDRLHDFRDLRIAFPGDARGADLAYKQSRSWVQYVTAEAGWPALRQVLADLALVPAGGAEAGEGASRLEASLLHHTERSLGEWHASWRTALEEDARPWFLHVLTHDFQGVLIAGLACIGLATFALVIRRRRRQLAELPDEP